MNEIVDAISKLGFPIAMCLGACFFIKYQFDTFNKSMEEMRKEHKEEVTNMTKAIENNTIALTRLIERDKE